MKLESLKNRSSFTGNRLKQKYERLQALVEALRQRELEEDIISYLNHEVGKLNAAADGSMFKKQLRISQSRILSKLERKAKIVTKHHYRNMWLALGIGVFGVPIGVILGNLLDNQGLIGIGFPFGMFIGIMIGLRMDKKAEEKGNLIDIVML